LAALLPVLGPHLVAAAAPARALTIHQQFQRFMVNALLRLAR
jgi:hypothetical protein